MTFIRHLLHFAGKKHAISFITTSLPITEQTCLFLIYMQAAMSGNIILNDLELLFTFFVGSGLQSITQHAQGHADTHTLPKVP